MSKTPKLHEVLAVLADLEGTQKKIHDETIKTFSSKQGHFQAAHRTLSMFDDARKPEEAGAEQRSELVTTVADKLDYMSESHIRYWDALLQQEATNQIAKADLEVNGKIIAQDLPATFLLAMEKRLKNLRGIYAAIPTLDPGVEWVEDTSAGKNIFKTAYPERTQKQEKAMKHQVLVEPTEHHPAQIEKWAENVVVGTYSITRQSSMITPAQKSEYLERIDNLIHEVKKARQRANSTEIVKKNIGKDIFEYITKG